MAGIYLHVPFCKKACTYCDFHFSTSLKLKTRMLAAMRSELAARIGELPGKVATIYFGGGTPSLLDDEEIGGFLDAIRALRTVEEDVEVTLETNPDDIDRDRLAAWSDIGITRISLGTQSFRDDRLRFMGRAHDSEQALRSIANIAKAGFRSWTIDLIYGLPGMTLAEWDEQLTIALDHGMPHLSAYCLTVEDRTALAHQLRKGLFTMQDDEDQSAQFSRLIERMGAAGLEHYEISNFGRQGHFSRHNMSYWSGTPYLGIGPSAHSYSGDTRRWNTRNNARYVDAVERGLPHWESETLSAVQRTNERLLTGLRTKWGVELAQLEHDVAGIHRSVVDKHVDMGTITLGDGRLVLTVAGRHFADRIAAELFVSDDR